VRVGPYELQERIGIGGMAEVYKATQTGEEGFERVVAVKRILPNVAADESFVAMFVDEAKIAVQLSHPNIAQIYDLGKDGETYFIALEYVHGKDMGAIVRRHEPRGPLPIPFALHVALKVAEALSHAHTARGPGGRPLELIHRDVSPQNILVSFEGAVKVIDFGLAKATGRSVNTEHGVVKGKLAYLSAEQAQGNEIDNRSDLFSLGTCLYEWLSGERLFLRKNDLETVLAVQRAHVPPLRTKRPDVPPALEALVAKALAADPGRRFQTASDMHDAMLSFAYESGNTMPRRKFANVLQELFPEEAAGADVLPVQVRRDTVPSGPMVLDEIGAHPVDDDPFPDEDTQTHDDLAAAFPDALRPQPVPERLGPVHAADLSDGEMIVSDDEYEEVDEEVQTHDLAIEPSPVWDEPTGDFGRQAEILAQTPEARPLDDDGDDEFDDATRQYPQELVRDLLSRPPGPLDGTTPGAPPFSDETEDRQSPPADGPPSILDDEFDDATRIDPLEHDQTNPDFEV